MANKIERFKPSLEIDEDIDMHITGWVIQRIGWFLMLAFLLCAALGLFGTGILSPRSDSQNGSSVKYERFGRNQNDTEVEIKAESKAGRIEVELPDAFTRSFKVETIIPDPQEQRIADGSTTYIFPSEGAGEITLFVTARKSGSVNTTLKVNGNQHPFKTYIYP